jgi:hypothetical protein
MWSVLKGLDLFFYNIFGHVCNWVSLIAFNVFPSCIDAPLPTLLPLVETVLVCLFLGLHVVLSANFPQSLDSFEIVVLSKWISVWETRRLLEPGQVSRVAEEAQLCSCWPKSHKSVAMHELVHCHVGGPGVVSPQLRYFSPDIFS